MTAVMSLSAAQRAALDAKVAMAAMEMKGISDLHRRCAPRARTRGRGVRGRGTRGQCVHELACGGGARRRLGHVCA